MWWRYFFLNDLKHILGIFALSFTFANIQYVPILVYQQYSRYFCWLIYQSNLN